MAKELKEMTKRADNYSQWYNDLVVKADLAEQSAVRGCMVIKPYGYAIWEKMQAQLDKMFKETGAQNAYFPRQGKANGTSFASPTMCGMVACLWQACPTLTAKEIIELVRQSGDRAAYPDNIYGYGIPNIWQAYQSYINR